MHKRVLWLCLLSGTLPGWSQGMPTFNAPLPNRSQVLKLHYKGLLKWSDQHTVRTDEVRQDYLAEWYAEKRRAANQPLLANKPALRKAMAAVRAWSDAYYEVQSEYFQGGTLYTHSANRSVADLADVEEEAALQWGAHPKAGPALKPIGPRKSSVDEGKMPEGVQDKSRYKRIFEAEAAALERAKAAVAELPPGSRSVLVRYLSDTCNIHWGEG